MTRKMRTEEKIGYGYPIKPPSSAIPDSFEGKVSKKHKMLFLIHKKALKTETPIFQKTCLTKSTFILTLSISAFVCFFNNLFSVLFSFFSRVFSNFRLILKSGNDTNPTQNSLSSKMLEKCSSKNAYISTTHNIANLYTQYDKLYTMNTIYKSHIYSHISIYISHLHISSHIKN